MKNIRASLPLICTIFASFSVNADSYVGLNGQGATNLSFNVSHDICRAVVRGSNGSFDYYKVGVSAMVSGSRVCSYSLGGNVQTTNEFDHLVLREGKNVRWVAPGSAAPVGFTPVDMSAIDGQVANSICMLNDGNRSIGNVVNGRCVDALYVSSNSSTASSSSSSSYKVLHARQPLSQ